MPDVGKCITSINNHCITISEAVVVSDRQSQDDGELTLRVGDIIEEVVPVSSVNNVKAHKLMIIPIVSYPTMLWG